MGTSRLDQCGSTGKIYWNIGSKVAGTMVYLRPTDGF